MRREKWTSQRFDRHIEEKRQAQDRIDTNLRCQKESNILNSQGGMAVRCENARRSRLVGEARKQAELAERLRLNKIENERRRLMDEQTARTAAILKKKADDKLREDAKVRRVRESSDEIKQLERKLKLACVNKERELQLAQSALLKDQQKTQDVEIFQQMEQIRLSGIKAQELKESQRKDKLKESKAILERQLMEKEQRKVAEYERFLEEKEQVDAVMRKIEAEEREIFEKRQKQIAQTQKGIQEYLVQKAQWERASKEQERAELAKIQEYVRQQEERLQEIERQRAARKKADEARYESVKGDMERLRREAEDRENLLIELAIEEAALKLVEEEKRSEERRVRMREEGAKEHAEQKRLKEERVKQEKEEDNRLIAAMMAKFKEDERLEQLSRQAKKQKVLNHKREVEELMVKRKAAREEGQRLQRLAEEQKAKIEAESSEIIERERSRLLREYAAKLKGYLPKGVAKTDAEYKMIYG